jgi:periplasmic protein TonB
VTHGRTFHVVREVGHRLGVILGAVGLTLALFIVLPLMQTISQPPMNDLALQTVNLADVPPPPSPPPEEEREEEPQPEEHPPELVEATAPLDLSQLELALDPGFGDASFGGGDFGVRLSTVVTTAGGDEAAGADAIFSIADLDQKPRVVYQPGPVLTREIRQKAPGTVHILFLVDERGSVMEPRVQQSADPVFEKPALIAVRQWKFEPGKRGGKPVRFRMRVPITFPKG